MSKKYHITDDGPKVCVASIQSCRVGGDATTEHYQDLGVAQQVYEKQMKSETFVTHSKKENVNHEVLERDKPKASQALESWKTKTGSKLITDDQAKKWTELYKELDAYHRSKGNPLDNKINGIGLDRDSRITSKMRKLQVSLNAVESGRATPWAVIENNGRLPSYKSDSDLETIRAAANELKQAQEAYDAIPAPEKDIREQTIPLEKQVEGATIYGTKVTKRQAELFTIINDTRDDEEDLIKKVKADGANIEDYDHFRENFYAMRKAAQNELQESLPKFPKEKETAALRNAQGKLTQAQTQRQKDWVQGAGKQAAYYNNIESPEKAKFMNPLG